MMTKSKKLQLLKERLFWFRVNAVLCTICEFYKLKGHVFGAGWLITEAYEALYGKPKDYDYDDLEWHLSMRVQTFLHHNRPSWKEIADGFQFPSPKGNYRRKKAQKRLARSKTRTAYHFWLTYGITKGEGGGPYHAPKKKRLPSMEWEEYSLPKKSIHRFAEATNGEWGKFGYSHYGKGVTLRDHRRGYTKKCLHPCMGGDSGYRFD